MGKFLDRLREKSIKNGKKLDRLIETPINNNNFKKSKFKYPNSEKIDDITGYEDEENDYNNDYNYNDEGFEDDEVNIQKAQKPESFHHFILENKYHDLEMDIRGYKAVWDKETQSFKTKRKDRHCFTDEEAEMIVQKAQSNLSTDIKLSRISKESFGEVMDSIFKQLGRLFRRIMEYKFGRFGNYEIQGQMKSQAVDIFENLYRRIYANYSMAIGGEENKSTHQSVKGQESLQSGERDYSDRGRGYS